MNTKGATMLMPATGERVTSAADQRKAMVAMAQAMLFASPGAILYIQVATADEWAQLLTWLGPDARVRLVGHGDVMAEAIEVCAAGVTLHAQGPKWSPTLADYRRLRDQENA